MNDLSRLAKELARGINEAQVKKGLDEMTPEQLKVVRDGMLARADLERELVMGRAWNLLPASWRVKKRLAVLKYVHRVVESMECGPLQALGDRDLRRLIGDAAHGYDEFIARKMAKNR